MKIISLKTTERGRYAIVVLKNGERLEVSRRNDEINYYVDSLFNPNGVPITVTAPFSRYSRKDILTLDLSMLLEKKKDK